MVCGGYMQKELSEMSLEELWRLFPIILRDHNPECINWYKEEEKRLQNLLNKIDIARINHIGSTAVNGLIAKPTVDILLELKSNADVELLSKLLKQDCWILMHSEKDKLNLIFNKGYTEHGFAEKVYHLHVRYHEDWDELYFRDYLIAHGDIASEYALLKLTLKIQYEHNRDAYTSGKSSFIAECTQKARIEFSKRYKTECL